MRRRRMFAKAFGGMRRRRVVGEMNKTEARYAREALDLMKATGTILEYWFEEWTFKLAKDLRYTPDFVLLFADGSLEVREVKARNAKTGGYRAEDDAIAKIRMFADRFPLPMIVTWPRPKGVTGWDMKNFSEVADVR